MKKTVIMLLLPFLSTAQKQVPRFENDTLYTTSGFMIYPGQVLKLGTGTGKNGIFRYINIRDAAYRTSLTNTTVVVKELSHFGVSQLNNGYIEIAGPITFKDGTKGFIRFHMAFDKAIGTADTPGELIVPEEFRKKNDNAAEGTNKKSVADEIRKLHDLYKEGILTKEEYEAQKKKLLDN